MPNDLHTALPATPRLEHALAAKRLASRTRELEGRKEFAQLYLGDVRPPRRLASCGGKALSQLPLAQARDRRARVSERNAEPRASSRVRVERLEGSAAPCSAATHLVASGRTAARSPSVWRLSEEKCPPWPAIRTISSLRPVRSC